MSGRAAGIRGLLVALAVGAGSITHSAAATAVVTYLSGATIYLNAGERDGLVAGARLAPDAAAETVVLKAFEVSPRRAACRVVEGSADAVRVGDRFRYEAATRLAPAATEAAPERKPWGGHGRLGVRYLLTDDGINDGTDFQQPGLDAFLNAPSLYGTPWGARVDIRARRTFQSGTDVGRSRVYALSAGWDAAGPGWRFGLGRQFAPDLANVSVFDGALAAYDGERWTAGGFLGSQPAPDYGYSNDVREYGAFGGWRGAPRGPHRWEVSAGAVASYEQSTINREYFFVHGTYTGPRANAFFTQEIDLNRGWKHDAGESTIEPTSIFASGRIHALDWLDVYLGVDSRRNVRLYRDFVSPETAFDDAFRRGYWLGADARAGRYFRFGLNGRRSGGGSAGSADAITGTAYYDSGTRSGFDARARATRWTDDRLEGWLYALNVGAGIGKYVRLGVEGGRRIEDSLLNAELSDRVSWFGVSLDVDLNRSLFATLSVDRSEGDFEQVATVYATLAYRF